MANETWSICTCPMGHRPQGRLDALRVTICFGNTHKERAWLITAAPDMLAALEWAVETADTEQYEADWYAAARAAIAKAKGEVT